MGAQLLIETLPKWITGKINAIPQNEEEATYSRILTKKDGYIVWAKTAEEIERQMRALDPWPGSFTYIRIEKEKLLRLKILSADVLKLSPDNTPETEFRKLQEAAPGQILQTSGGNIAVQTGSGLLSLKIVQLEGKKSLEIKEFIKGYPEFIGSIL